MYKLEDRILFDAAAVADVADAQQEADAQAEAAAQAAEAEEAAAQEAAESADGGDFDNTEANEPGSLEAVLAAVEAGNLGSDGQQVDVLLVSNSLENAEDIINATSSDTIVVRYDARTTSAADLLQQITDALDGNLADSIGFATESGENAEVQLFADTDTSLDTVNDSTHQNFFNTLGGMMDEGAQVNLFASNLASTAEGTALVDAIGDSIGHDVAASTDETGSESAGGDWNLEYSTNDVETDLAETYLDENLIDNFDSLLEDSSNEVAFINSSVMNDDPIVQALEDRGVSIVHIENGKGLSQITDYLAEHSDIDAVHIITHGDDGYFLVGSDNINSESLSGYYADSMASWSNSLNSNADIMIYGCNLAETSVGQSLVDTIASLTGADVAASDDDTGSRGDWSLEYTAGDIETAALIVSDYQYTLANRMVNTLVDAPLNTLGDGIITLRRAITESVDGDSITFDSFTNLGGRTVTLVSSADPSGYGQLEITKQLSIDGTIRIDSNTYFRTIVTNGDPADPSNDFRLLYIADSAGTSETPVDIYRMIFDDGEAHIRADIDYTGEGNGGALYIAGAALLRDVNVTDSSAHIDGGGIYVASTGYLKIINETDGTSNCVISSNIAGTSGGGIFNNAGDLKLLGYGSETEDAVYVHSNTANAGSGAGIYSVGDVTATYAYIGSNSASNGDGGGVYISGGTELSSFSNSNITLNTAAGDGGGIYFFQSQDLTLNNSWITDNTAAGDGGGIYINESRFLHNVTSSINSNIAAGDGGGVYLIESGNFYQERGFINDNTAGGSGGAVYMTKSGQGVTDGYLSDLYLVSMDVSGNTTSTGNGTVYYDGVRRSGVSGAGSTIVYMSAIDNNTVTAGSGGAVYQTAGSLSVFSSTLAFNAAGTTGGAIHFSGDSLDVEFATLAYNETTTNGGADIYLSGTQQNFTVLNSIIYDADATAETQIVFGGTTPVSSTFNNNIYSSYAVDAALDSRITTMVTAGSGNIVGDDSLTPITNNTVVSRQQIIDNLYLDTEMRDYFNYYARVIPLLVDYNQAITEGTFGWRNIAWQTGTAAYNASIKYDTRGNTRIGYQYNEASHGYEQNATPSIGAFEPIYTIVVNSKDGGGGATFFDESLEDGITLRDAIYWMDSYDTITYANDAATGGALYNSNRYVKFDSVLFSETADNTITINSDIDITKSIIIGMTPWLNDQLDTYKATYAANDISVEEMTEWGGFRAQDAVGRIIINGSSSDRIFQTTTSQNTPGVTRRIYINNLTITEGYIDDSGSDDGRGGGIWNSTNLYLSNVAVTNSAVNNTDGSDFNDNAGWGAGIYNEGSLTLVESTVSGNTATGNSSSTDPADKAGLGGGIYSTGALTIESSSIHDNIATGSTNVSSESASGGGIYFDGGIENLIITNTTLGNNTADAEYSSAPTTHGQGSAIYLETGNLYMYYNTVMLNTSIRNTAEGTSGISAAVTSAYNYTTTSRDFHLYNNAIANNDYSFTGSPKTRQLFDLYLNVTTPTTTPSNVIVLNNVIGWTTGLTINETGGPANNNNNIIGDSVYGVVANLALEDTLAYNGGKTKSYKVLDNSRTYQNGLELDGTGGLPTVTIDQRGADRTYAGTAPTIGSYQPLQYVVITSTDDTRNGSSVGFDFSSNSGGWMKSDLQVREAFALADIGTQVILGYTVAPITPTNPVITLNQAAGFGELIADIGFTLDGRTYLFTPTYSASASAYTTIGTPVLQTTVAPLVIDGSNTSRIIHISDNTSTNINITLSYVTLQNGNSSTQGGAIYNWENLTLDNVSVLNSTATLQGGGIYSQLGTLTITNSLIQGNSSSTQGGGLYYESNSLSITNSSFLANTSTGNGGGFYAVGAQIAIQDSTIGNNVSGAHGGGIFSDSSDVFMINSTIANNTADENGGGMVFNGGGYLRMGYVTIANNISGADVNSVQQLGGGLYQSAGSLNIYNSIIAQNHQESIADANLNDFYLGTAVSFSATQVVNNVLGEYTNNSGNAISTINNKTRNTDGTYGTANELLEIDAVLADNGGDTMTIYIFAGSASTIDYGIDLYYTHNTADNSYTLSLASGTQILLDQIGNNRYLAANTITVGAYQKNITSWVYVGNATATETILEDISNWRDYTTGAAVTGSVQANDRTLYFDPTGGSGAGTDNVTITESWNVNYKTSIILDNVAHLTVQGLALPAETATLTAGLTVMGASVFTVGTNAAFAAATNTNVTLDGSGSQIIVNNTFSGTVNVTGATLTLNVADAKISNLIFGTLDSTSTVIYNYAGVQTVRSANYGNLTISNTGTKTANGAITVAGDLDNSSEFISAYDLTVAGDTTSTGNIRAANIYLLGTSNDVSGNLVATGTVTFAGGSSTGTISGITVNAEGTVENISATTINSAVNLHIRGTATATNLNANTLVLSNDASVTATNTDLTTITSTGAFGDSNTLKVIGTATDINSWMINAISGSTLNIDRGSNDIQISDGSVTPSFDVDNMVVSSTSTLKFITTANITLTAIVSANLPNFDGTLYLKSTDIIISQTCDFSGGDMSLFLDNSRFFDIQTGAAFTVNNSIGISNVRIIAGTGSTATIASTTGGVTIIGNVSSLSPNYNLVLNAATTAEINGLSGITDLTLNAGTTATVNGVVNISGDFTTTATTTNVNSNVTTGGDVSITGTLDLAANIAATGAVGITGTTTISGTANTLISGDTLSFGGLISGTGTGTLTLGASTASPTTNHLAGITLTNGGLKLSNGNFDTSAAISTVDLNISSPANLAMGTQTLTASGNLTNAGILASTGTVNANANITNTSTGTMTINTLTLGNTSNTSALSLNGIVNINTLNVAADKQVSLTSGTVAITDFNFTGAADSSSKFTLSTGTSLDVTGTIDYNAGAAYYDGNYFDTSGGGQLVRTMTGSTLVYRVGNSDSATVITLSTTAGEKIAAHVLDNIRFNGGVVTGIEDTAGFTTFLERDWGGTSGSDPIVVTENWSTALEGANFDPDESENLFVLDGSWTNAENITVTFSTPSTGRRGASYTLPHNGTYAFANAGANMTIPITNLNGNIALWEMSNPNYSSILGDVDNLSNFPIGQYPYFSTRGIFGDPASVGRSVYRHMEYRMAMNPLSNPLTGQVPAPGTLLGQAITEGADLNLTSDASVYLEVNGEYSIGRGWLPVGEPVSAANVEQYQAPITEGQLDEFYLEFGGRESIFDKPASFRSDLDEILDDLLAG